MKSGRYLKNYLLKRTKMSKLKSKKYYRDLFDKSEWTFEALEEADKLCEIIAKEELNIDIYTNQYEVVTSEQLLDAMSLIGLPISYPHWSFGKNFSQQQTAYKRGQMGLSYEMIINSNPCISYNMEDNTTCLMLLVIAHAGMGHNHFFKNNYMFKQWTNADTIVDYMKFARDYILKCEEIYGPETVEEVLDACHSIQDYGVDKYKKPTKISPEKERKRFLEALEFERKDYNPLWDTIPNYKEKKKKKQRPKKALPQPEENILYFIEKNSPSLPIWKREIVRICRKISQYFYPQAQTKMINEGFATFSHYYIVNSLYDKGYLSEGFMLEFIKHHTGVITQPAYNSNYYSGINPYTMGFNIFMDIKRICEDPTEEDKKWFPELIGKDWREEIIYAAANYRDDSFVSQYLSPKVIRDMRLFEVTDIESEKEYSISSIHDEEGYKSIIETLSNQYNRERYLPDIQVTGFDKNGDRSLVLTHNKRNKQKLDEEEADEVVYNIHQLWNYPVYIVSEDEEGHVDEVSYYGMM